MDTHPTVYHLINIPPYSSNQTDLAIAIKLKDQLLTMLLNIGAITQSDINQEKINTETPYFQIDQDPYFTEYVINKLMEKYSNYVLAGGLKVYTTVNTQIDNMAQQVVSEDYQKYVAPVDAVGGFIIVELGFVPRNSVYDTVTLFVFILITVIINDAIIATNNILGNIISSIFIFIIYPSSSFLLIVVIVFFAFDNIFEHTLYKDAPSSIFLIVSSKERLPLSNSCNIFSNLSNASVNVISFFIFLLPHF